VNGHQRLRHRGYWEKAASRKSFTARRGTEGGCTEQQQPREKHSSGNAGEQVKVGDGWCSGRRSHTLTRGRQGRRYHFPHGEHSALRSRSERITTQLRPALKPLRRPQPGQRCRTASSVSSAANCWPPRAEALCSTRHCPFMHSPLSHIMNMRCPI
jgi:hypothetical protein